MTTPHDDAAPPDPWADPWAAQDAAPAAPPPPGDTQHHPAPDAGSAARGDARGDTVDTRGGRVHAGGGVAATARGGSTGEPPQRAPSQADTEPVDVPGVLLPPTVRDARDRDRELEARAEDARANGHPVPAEPGDDRATLALKARIARAHLDVETERGAHASALRFLDDVVAGRVEATEVTKDGDTVTVDLHPRHRITAARALLDHAAKVTKDAPVHIDHANILTAGDLIARVDGGRLRAAVDRLRGRGAQDAGDDDGPDPNM